MLFDEPLEDVIARLVVESDVPPVRAAVQVGEVLDVVQVETVAFDEVLHRRARVVEEVLVVDGVERAAIDEVPNARVLHRDHAVVGQEVCHPGDEVVRVGDVGHHVVRDDDVGGLALGA